MTAPHTAGRARSRPLCTPDPCARNTSYPKASTRFLAHRRDHPALLLGRCYRSPRRRSPGLGEVAKTVCRVARPVVDGCRLEAFLLVVPLASVLFECRDAAIFRSRVENAQRQRSSNSVNAIRHGGLGHARGM